MCKERKKSFKLLYRLTNSSIQLFKNKKRSIRIIFMSHCCQLSTIYVVHSWMKNEERKKDQKTWKFPTGLFATWLHHLNIIHSVWCMKNGLQEFRFRYIEFQVATIFFCFQAFILVDYIKQIRLENVLLLFLFFFFILKIEFSGTKWRFKCCLRVWWFSISLFLILFSFVAHDISVKFPWIEYTLFLSFIQVYEWAII